MNDVGRSVEHVTIQRGDLLKLRQSATLWSAVDRYSNGIDADDDPETFQQHVICLETRTTPHRLRPERLELATRTVIVWMSGGLYITFQNEIESIIPCKLT